MELHSSQSWFYLFYVKIVLIYIKVMINVVQQRENSYHVHHKILFTHILKNMDQEAIIKSIVRIHSYGRNIDFSKPFKTADRNKSVGTGSFIEPPVATPGSLYVLTCAHCIDGADTVAVLLPLQSQIEIPATVISFVPQYDLAILHIPDVDGHLRGTTSHFQLGRSDNLKLGNRVISVGFPLGQTALKVSDGVYAGFQNSLQITAPISPGCSGGPLLNEANEIIGVNNSGIVALEANNIGYSIPIEFYLNQKTRMFSVPVGPPSPERVLHLPSFGALFHEATRSQILNATAGAQCCQSGVYISKVLDNSPAASVMKAGDILCSFDSLNIENTGELAVPWNYQKIQLENVFKRSVDEQKKFPLIVWSNGNCNNVEMTPKDIMRNGNRELFPPYDPVAYVAFMGFCFMELHPNHMAIPTLIKAYIKLKIEELQSPHLIIVHVFNGMQSQSTGILREGDFITEVNGRSVSTLAELRESFKTPIVNENGGKMLSVANDNGSTFMLSVEDVLEEERRSTAIASIYVQELEIITILKG